MAVDDIAELAIRENGDVVVLDKTSRKFVIPVVELPELEKAPVEAVGVADGSGASTEGNVTKARKARTGR